MGKEKETSIVAFAPALPDTPGWSELTREKQDELLEITGRLLQFQSMEGLGVVGQCVELIHAKRALEGQPMNITAYTESVFRQGSRTAWRRLAEFEELSKYWPEDVTKALAEKGATLLRGAAGGGMRELINVAKVLPAPKSKEPKTIEAFIEKEVREKLRERRRGRTLDKPEPIERSLALKIWFNTTMRILRSAKLRTSEQQRDWLTQGVGYVMHARAIPGAVHTGRIEIPDGFIARRGPKPKRKLNRAA